MTDLLEIENLSIRYSSKLAVEDVSLRIGAEAVVLFGPSGCGKSSILKAILGVRETGMEIGGSIRFGAERIGDGDGRVGMVFQGPVLPGWLRLVDQCRLGSRLRKLPRKEGEAIARDLLKEFGIEELAESYPSRMSGGERQRGALVVTLSNEPSILLLDEPTTFLDGVARVTAWEILENQVRQRGIPRVIVSHDPDEAILLGDRVLKLAAPAKVIREIKVDLPHPRTIDLKRDEVFWAYREDLLS